MYYIILCALIAALFHQAIAQTSNPVIGARSAGVGYASACLTDGWAVFNNPAGLAKVSSTEAASAYESVSGFSPFNRTAFAFSAPLFHGGAAIGLFRFGNDLYSEQMINAGYANKFGIASLGLSAHYIKYSAEGFGQKSVFSFSFGGIAELTSWLKFGAMIRNIIQPEITPTKKLPTLMIASLCLEPSSAARVLVEIEKSLDYKPKVRAGFEYNFHKKFFARSGVNVNPQALFFGVGFHPRKCKVDYAYSMHSELLSAHQISIGYTFKSRK